MNTIRRLTAEDIARGGARRQTLSEEQRFVDEAIECWRRAEARRESRRGFWRLMGWSAVIVGLCAAAVWWILQ